MGDIHDPRQSCSSSPRAAATRRRSIWARSQCESEFGPLSPAASRSISPKRTTTTPRWASSSRSSFGVRAVDRSGPAPRNQTANERVGGEYAALSRHPEPRPLNLDPGYLTPAKLVLASTKDHAHRIYLARRHLRRGDARRIASGSGSPGMDLPRLSPRRLSAVLHPVPRMAAELRPPRRRGKIR